MKIVLWAFAAFAIDYPKFYACNFVFVYHFSFLIAGDVSSGMSNVTATSFTIFDQNIYGQMQAFTNQAISAGPLSFF